MMINQQPFYDIAKIEKKDEGCIVYSITNESESVIITDYKVFEGINIIFYDIHGKTTIIEKQTDSNIVEIIHCRAGRCERKINNEYIYLSNGDMAIFKKSECDKSVNYPLSHYHGISISVDTDKAPECLSCFLKDVNVSPKNIEEKFCSNKVFYIARSKEQIEHIFSEIYNVPESIKRGYFKVKILELFLFLSGIDVETDSSKKRIISKEKKSLANAVCRYLTENMDKRITIEELSLHFHVSATQIKNSFKEFYDISIYSYVKAQKMQAAAIMLVNTYNTVLDIAGKFGYNNASKFSSAFKEEFSITPNEYRKKSNSES